LSREELSTGGLPHLTLPLSKAYRALLLQLNHLSSSVEMVKDSTSRSTSAARQDAATVSSRGSGTAAGQIHIELGSANHLHPWEYVSEIQCIKEIHIQAGCPRSSGKAGALDGDKQEDFLTQKLIALLSPLHFP